MSLIDKIHMLKKILKEAVSIIAWQELIYTALHNIHADWVVSGRFGMSRMPDMALDKIMVGQGAGNNPVEQDIPTVSLKAGSVTDTTTAAGLISVVFAEAFASTPVVMVQIESDVDYYPVMISRSTTGFTVKILKTAHVHSNPNTSAVSAGTPAGTISSVSAGTPSGTIGDESSHTHNIGFASGVGGSHRHTCPSYTGYESSHTHSQGATGAPSATVPCDHCVWLGARLYAAAISGGSPTTDFLAANSVTFYSVGSNVHTHTNPTTGAGSSHRHTIGGYTGYEFSHTHGVSGTSEAGSSHSHSFYGIGLGAHNHTFTGSALGTHSHTIADTDSANAGSTLANTSVTFSYIAMVP